MVGSGVFSEYRGGDAEPERGGLRNVEVLLHGDCSHCQQRPPRRAAAPLGVANTEAHPLSCLEIGGRGLRQQTPFQPRPAGNTSLTAGSQIMGQPNTPSQAGRLKGGPP